MLSEVLYELKAKILILTKYIFIMYVEWVNSSLSFGQCH
jgi:hypothetical protein